ncbi:hypothetical protein TIFTF001_024831 [Ficus carica]|uniref:Uncharacterized protein n=1 Tax=Ficus carica TaxID=3494 RepID=A0AA88DDP0_FICCA|nr:hypothetical protein TIFTF001_024831 [Ficus carica]
MPVNPPEPNLATVVATLQRQLLEQQQETDRLREQLAQMNQRPQVNEVPPPVHQVPPVVPPVPEVQPEAPEFEGLTDPIAADNWLIDIQVILDFMRLTEQEKVLCASFALKKDDKEARAQIFKAKKEEKVVVKQIQPRQNAESFPKGQNNNPAQSSKQFGRNKRKGNFTGQGQQKNYPQKRNNRGNEGNNTDFPMCTKCGRKIREYVEWGRKLATFVARRGIMRGIAL